MVLQLVLVTLQGAAEQPSPKESYLDRGNGSFNLTECVKFLLHAG